MRRGAVFGLAWWFRVFVLLTFALPAAGFAQPPTDGAAAAPEDPPATPDEAGGAAPTVDEAGGEPLTAEVPELNIQLPDLAAVAGQAGGRADHAIHLGVDGNLPGRVLALDGSGTAIPVRATIRFVRDGQTVTTVRSDERGNFQVIGLRPGPYSVIAMNGRTMTGDARDYVGAAAVLVLPYDPTASPEQNLLTMILIPMEDLSQLVAELLGGENLPIPPGMMMPGGFPMMGGGGGGGEGLAALLGLAGLAGLAGSQGGARVPPVASPFVP